MKITFVSSPANLSGGVRVIAIYAEALSRFGHEVTVILPARKKFKLAKKIRYLLSGKGWPKYVKRPPSHFDGLDIDIRLLDSWRPVVDSDVPDADVVISTWWATAEWVSQLSPHKGSKVYFIQHHEVHSHLPIAQSAATYSLPMHKIVVAKWLQEVMYERYGDKVVDVVPNSVDHDLFHAPERSKQEVPTVGFLYSKSEFKGVDVTIEAIRQLKRDLPELRVISFGKVIPDWENDLQLLIDFYHSPPQDTIRKLYAECDIWFTASTYEGFNLPAMEAMACRTPVVSTKAGWPAEAVVTGKNGALVEVGDSESLAREGLKILTMVNDEWKKISRNAFETVADSSWSNSAKLFEAALLHACQRSKAGEIEGSCKNSE